MSYQKQQWTDEVLSGEKALYTLKNNADGTVINDNVDIIMKTPVEQAGTVVSAARMNHIENGIEAANKEFETSTSNIKPDGTASVGTLSTVARADHVHPLNLETEATNIKPLDIAASVGVLDTIARADHVHPDGDTGWIQATLINSFVGSAYYRKVGKIVFMKGIITSGGTNGTSCFVLPAEYRPPESYLFRVIAFTGGAVGTDALAIVQASGNVILNFSTFGNNGIYLSPINFIVGA